ncbi:MAG: LysE family translocator [Thermoanaerobaculia bacterium]
MIDPDRLLLFLGASLVLLVAPGPAVLHVVATSVDRGRRWGVLAAVGLTAGNLVHVASAAVGLSALLAASSVAFAAIRYGGAAYLVVLGVLQTVRHRRMGSGSLVVEEAARRAAPAPGPWAALRRGAVVNVLNPKIAFFFLAFLPQFVDPARGAAALQVLLLGLLFALLTLVVCTSYALLAGAAADLVRRRWPRSAPRVGRAAGYVPGVVYIGLGLTAALVPVERR